MFSARLGPRQCVVGHDRAVGCAGNEYRPFFRYNVVAADHSAALLTRLRRSNPIRRSSALGPSAATSSATSPASFSASFLPSSSATFSQAGCVCCATFYRPRSISFCPDGRPRFHRALRRAVEFCQCASIVTSHLAGAFYGSRKQPVAPISKQKVTDASPTRRSGALRMTLSSSAKDRPIALHPIRLFPFGNERRLHRSVF